MVPGGDNEPMVISTLFLIFNLEGKKKQGEELFHEIQGKSRDGDKPIDGTGNHYERAVHEQDYILQRGYSQTSVYKRNTSKS